MVISFVFLFSRASDRMEWLTVARYKKCGCQKVSIKFFLLNEIQKSEVFQELHMKIFLLLSQILCCL